MTKTPEIEISNLTNEITEEEICQIVGDFIDAFSLDLSDHHLEIIFSSEAEMKAANKQHRGIDKSTDVLSFPQADQPHPSPIWGTIIISPLDAAARDEEIGDLIKHGLLHLAGFDHETDPESWKSAAIKINHQMGI